MESDTTLQVQSCGFKWHCVRQYVVIIFINYYSRTWFNWLTFCSHTSLSSFLRMMPSGTVWALQIS